ncbi:succinate dehydrogenase/fumarate reductase flavoprotein subunit [Paenibacillus shirakamiensis]|uniref:Succinate dehydrogenase/fumarate reductase flavoprotein subunit n=1 Tax=Paenibacillus shirakamiensis TaxID=1265935 RepID=A0ABS4JF11_9BACL|nr:FAD-binding protein [Paenibacillus shirakamiensis]MBP2000288.1 succinate dehydrogenase/fumarate reductase flavoprotein subunit [Paenibacillus shirakamiensis]
MSLNEKRLCVDVLVLGGGPAGAWSAWSAASQGATVLLADKGYLGTSGATAPGGTTLLVIPPVARLREEAVQQRLRAGGYLSENAWIHRVLDQVEQNLEQIEQWGYPFPKDQDGTPLRTHLQGPEYMALMRKVVRKAGVKIWDQSPALELIHDEHGVAGARGIDRLSGKEWLVQANAVIVATGGCAFLSKGLGCNVLTGEGLLMSSEIGAELSGMEFSRQYAPSFADGTVTRGRMLAWSTLYDAEDQPLLQGERTFSSIPELLMKGPVYAKMDLANTAHKREFLRRAHPIFFMPLERAGIDPFEQKFPLTLRYEGTMRGTGGLRLMNKECSTTVPGLYAAGDAASREKVTGAISGGGAYNASWAMCSGTWAGAGAAKYALAQSSRADQRKPTAAGQYGLPAGVESTDTLEIRPLISSIQAEILPLHINYFRSISVLSSALERLHALVPYLKATPPSTVQGKVQTREAAAMLMVGRWMYTAALARKESRGLQQLADYPEMDPYQTHRLLVSGIEKINIRTESVPHAHELSLLREERAI